MQAVLRPYVVDIDAVEEEGEGPIGDYGEHEGEGEVGNKGEQRRDGRERVGGEWREVGHGGNIRGQRDIVRHGC